MEIIGYALAVIIGISLGLIGGGGSILTVPILVYLLGVSPVMATAYSLFIVGMSSLIGAIRYAKSGLIDLRTAVTFAIPSILAVFLTRKFMVPAIPDVLFSLGSFSMTKSMLIMLVFAVLMLFASIGMIRDKKQSPTKNSTEQKAWVLVLIIILEGFVVGMLTGLVGAGGGFLIIPALVLLLNLKMKTAIGTSLLIISAKSLIGFMGDVTNYTIDWPFLLLFSALAIAGIFIGINLSNKVDGKQLKKGFGYFVLVMGIAILLKELV